MKRTTAIAKRSKAKRPEAREPEIFVKAGFGRFSRAHIRVKSGVYQYLSWRDGDKIGSFYLGKKRKL